MVGGPSKLDFRASANICKTPILSCLDPNSDPLLSGFGSIAIQTPIHCDPDLDSLRSEFGSIAIRIWGIYLLKPSRFLSESKKNKRFGSEAKPGFNLIFASGSGSTFKQIILDFMRCNWVLRKCWSLKFWRPANFVICTSTIDCEVWICSYGATRFFKAADLQKKLSCKCRYAAMEQCFLKKLRTAGKNCHCGNAVEEQHFVQKLRIYSSFELRNCDCGYPFPPLKSAWMINLWTKYVDAWYVTTVFIFY